MGNKPQDHSFVAPSPQKDTAEECDGSRVSHHNRDVLQVKSDDGNEDSDTQSISDDGTRELNENYSMAEMNRVKRKIDYFILPIMWILYGTQLADKTSLGTQAIFGLRKDTHLKGQEYQWLTTAFYLSYLFAEFPSSFVMQRYSIGKVLSIYMLLWGVVVGCLALCHNFEQLVALRTLQGIFECAISPGFSLLIGLWYTRQEQVSRALFFTSANTGFSIFSDLINYGIAKSAEKHSGLAPWRLISLWLGCLTIVCGLLNLIFLGSPSEVWWLNKREAKIANARVEHNQTGIDTTGKKWDWGQVRIAFEDPQTYFFFINTFLSTVPNGGLTTFSNILLNEFGFNQFQVILINIPRSVISVICFVLVGLACTKWDGLRLYSMSLACLISFVGFLGMALLPDEHSQRWNKWGCYILTSPFTLGLFLSWSLLSSNCAGRTKKTVQSSLIFLSYCAGNMVGSQIFRTKDAPRYVPGVVGCCVCFGLEAIVCLVWREYYAWINRRREKWVESQRLSDEDRTRFGKKLGIDDVTDMKNPYFIYTL